MSLNYVTLTVTAQDAGQDAGTGQVTVIPTSVVTAAGITVVSQDPVVRTLSGGAASIQLVASDNAGTTPAAGFWAYSIQVGGAKPQLYLINFANGATQRLDSLTPVTAQTTYGPASGPYLPLPSGTPQAGQVPIATGTGEASAWGSAGSASLPLTTLGDILYEDATPVPARLAGNTTSTRKFLRQQGTGSVSAAPAWDTLQAADVPTLNQNTTGTAAGVTGTVAIANGGTGQVTQQAAMDAIAGAVTSGQYLRGNGTHVAMGAIQAGDVPTLNQNTTGSSASCTGNAATASNLAGGATLPAYVAPQVVPLTDGSSVALNAAAGNDFRWTLGGSSHTLTAPSNPVNGQPITIAIKYSGSFTPLFNAIFDFGAGGQPSWSAASGKTDYAGFRYDSALNGGAGAWAYMGSILGLTS